MTSTRTWKARDAAEAFFPVELRPLYMPAGNALNDFQISVQGWKEGNENDLFFKHTHPNPLSRGGEGSEQIHFQQLKRHFAVVDVERE